MNKLFLLAASSDIATSIAQRFLLRGDQVWGTYRKRNNALDGLEGQGAILARTDLADPADIAALTRSVAEADYHWDVLISAVGLLDPIGPFFSLDFDEWERSVIANSTAQLRALHALYPLRDKTKPCKIVLFAGGGTNNPFDNYSAYCLGKLALIKMCELLHSEYPNVHISILGTGWVNTKIHQQTLDAGEAAGANFERTKSVLNAPQLPHATLEDVSDCIDWCLNAPRDAVGGRNFSVVYDPWRSPAFVKKLQADPNLCKLRRAQDY